jgi:transcriptional regulator with XRE-family HTH domain
MTTRREHLARRRKVVGLSQEELAERVGVDPATVRRWEAGRTAPRPWLRPKLAEVLRTSTDQLDALLQEGSGDRSVTDGSLSVPVGPSKADPRQSRSNSWPVVQHLLAFDEQLLDGEFVTIPLRTPDGIVAYVITRRAMLASLTMIMPLGAEAAGDSPDPADRESLRTVTRLLATQRQSVSPSVLIPLANAHRDSLSAQFKNARTESARADIGIFLGETWILSSRLHSALGNRAVAVAQCANARRLADQLGNVTLGAMARIFESNLHSEAATLLGDGVDIALALHMLDEAVAVGDALSPSVQARIAAEQAQTYAALRLRIDCQKALDRAREAVDRIDDRDRHGLFSDWNASRLLVYEGTCLLFLGDHARATDTLVEAVQNLSTHDNMQNIRLAAQVDLTSALAQGGDLASACELLAETYRSLCSTGNSRGISRAHHARRRMSVSPKEPAIVRLDEQMRAASNR